MRKALNISRRNFIRSTSVAAAGLTVGATENAFSQSSEDGKTPKQPHIIFIMTDQQRFMRWVAWEIRQLFLRILTNWLKMVSFSGMAIHQRQVAPLRVPVC